MRLPRIVHYAEAQDREDTEVDRAWAWVQGAFVAQGARWRALRLRPILRAVRRHEARYAAMSDDALRAAVRDLRIMLRQRLRGHDLPTAAAGEAFALIREAATRVLGKRHYDVQILGAWAMLRGQIGEMRTGEGKTLCATLAVATIALSGRQVHVMTVNDYLTERDAEETGPLYDFLGLTRATVLEGQDGPTRQAAYLQDIVYGTNKELAFDYLRDRAILRRSPGNLQRKVDKLVPGGGLTEPLRMQGLPFAILDEADSVLIDEARTPLIISGAGVLEGGMPDEVFIAGMAAARDMVEGRHFKLPRGVKRVEILDAGYDFLDDLTEDRTDTFAIPVIRDHAVQQALNALHLFHLGDAYIVKDDKVQIVDENTGRTMPDRTWSDGLHQMIELKEGLEISPTNETLSRMTYQRFFRRYGRLGGMTGTAQDAAWELWTVYKLAVVKIPTNKPDIRTKAPDRVFRTAEAKWQAITARVAQLHAAGKPVLIGTRSILASQEASVRLTAAGLPHMVLSADQDADEAAIVAQAGQPGQITVATNMAGRGTDIKLGQGVAANGGLTVILTERHDSRRVDRQLEGRCGRQGEPGRNEAYLSLEDDLMQGPDAARARRLAYLLSFVLGTAAVGGFIRSRQRRTETLHAQSRRDLMKQDRQLGDIMAFSGQLE
ncbi:MULTISPECIES: preprotein translocase subunit SecA [unclassified Yoonia]|uniref:preprotein translocase subunit SecA n=1 Tax=unclassified Yoonia TaxID=2629118 RepID=UPI002AFE4B84|nr:MULTISPECIES: preprotein translocase subunit SecA [unclassified Yoonia]